MLEPIYHQVLLELPVEAACTVVLAGSESDLIRAAEAITKEAAS